MENNAGANPNNNITSGQKFHLNFSSSSAIFLLWLTLTGISIAAIVIILVQPSHSPDFSNPHMGFETKSTILSGRNDVLVNLAEASKPYGFITSNPEGKRLQILQGRMHRQKLESWQHTLFKESKVDSLNDLPKVHTHSVFVNSNSTVLDQVPPSLPPNLKQEHQNSSHFIFPSDSSLIQSDASITSDGDVGHVTMVDYDEDEDGHYGEAHNHSHVNKDAFCGQPTWSHARLIISNKKEGENLWKLDVIKELCSLEKEIEPLYTEICETQTPQNCCPMWSLTRYLLLASNKSSCEELQEDDLLNCADLLQECTHHFHNLDLECIEEEGTCQLAPNRCTRKSIVRGLMNFIFDIGFLPPNSSDQNEHVLKFIQIILPIAKSTKSYDFYKRLQALSLSHYKQIKIVAMDLGLEDYIFDKLLIHDSIRISMIISALILIILLLFIRSFLMIFFGLLNIVLSLAISYWLYCETLGADRFPFLNLMAALLLLAIGTDDLLFIAHSWQDYHDLKLKDKLWSLTPLWFSVTATSLTTAAAMFAARLSSVTSIALFSIFAGSTMMIHWMMTIFWMIPSVVISEMIAKFFNVHRTRCRMFEKLSCGFHKLGYFLRTTLLWIISKASLICILLMTILTVASTYAILISPRLRAPDSKSFALFQPSHPFERYHSDFTESFWFEKHQKSSRDILPLTWVWGLKPIDSRDLLNPNSKPNGSLLVFDKTFDISKPKAQLFLRRFCRQLKSQPFYKSVLGPLLQNCFLESLISYMNRKCYDSIDQLDRKPCCETSKFPYAPKTFAICLERAMKDLHNTPAQFFMPTLAGPKFDMRIKGNVSVAKAVVIQYDSSREFSLSFQQMDSFFREVESWTVSMLKTAPNSMKGGFFTSDLQFYDLQNKLMTESVTSVIVAATACSIVLYLSTCNLIITLLAAFSVYTILASSLAFLALLGWRLNVLESLAVTMAAGLSVDFVLHYAIKYNGHLDREQRIKHLIVKNLTPICVASITTIITGLMLLTSEVLAFNQIGIFIIDLTVHSFCISNFGFLSLLYRFGPSFKTDWEFCQKLCTVAEFQDEINVTSQAPLSDSNSVTLTGLAPMGPELHELENMSPTFLEDPNQRDHIFDTVLAGAGTRQTCNIRRPSCTTMEPLLQDRH